MAQEWKLSDFTAKLLRQAAETQACHLDFLAIAVLQSTGLRPEELELVQQQTATGIRWYFQRREPAQVDAEPIIDAELEG